MDWKTLFLDANGRMGRKDFWIGFLVVLVANLVFGVIPILGHIGHLALIYVWVCLSSKRLHDMGHSGWLTLAPYVIWVVALIAVIFTSGAALLSAAVSGSESALAAAFGAVGMMGLLLGGAALFGTAFLLWIGLTPPQAGDNTYGPAPDRLVTAF